MTDLVREFRRRVEERAATRRVPSASGLGLFHDEARDVYDANGLRVDVAEPPDAAALAAEADALMEGFFHRRVAIDGPQPRLDNGFRALGWEVTPHLVMELRRPLDRAVDDSMVCELPFDDVLDTRRLVTLREPWGDPTLADALDLARRRIHDAVPTRWFAARCDGQLAGYCELRSDGRVAQIEDVNVLYEFRGRGLGRALVQHASGEAAGSEVVFLEALADDWPRELYARMGFDVVAERRLYTRQMNPLAQLVLRTPRLELRLATRAELRALARVAQDGVHPPDEMPFAAPWTDRASLPEFEDEFVAFHESALAEWQQDDWNLNFVVFHEGKPIGSQGILAERFAETRIVKTGSWLGQPWQGRGLGTEMRTAVLALAFEGLGAERTRSGAIEGNHASLGVSRKLGYAQVGTSTVAPRGEPLPHHDLELTRDRFRPAVDVRVDGLDRVRDLFGRP